MKNALILASGSQTRAQLMTNAGLDFEVVKPRVDEDAIKTSLILENAAPRDIADTLAEFKARRVGQKHPNALVLGCDQVAELDQQLINKPESPDQAKDQLTQMSGKTHRLLSAAVIYHGYEPIWRHVGVVRLTMRKLSPAYIDAYVERNWESIRYSVGSYKLEEEGVRLFSQVAGDYFNVLGLPLTELLSYLITRGDLET
ncbi:MAG: Maf family protein [Maritimibacter sp.]